MEADQAMQEYISCVNVLDPEGCTKVMTKISENLIPSTYLDCKLQYIVYYTIL